MCTVLLIEDAHELRSHLTTLLDEAGYAVIPAGTVNEGVRLFRKHSIDIAIVDLKLPNGSGLRVIEKIHSEIDNLIITGDKANSNKNLAKEYAVYIEKPFTAEELIFALDNMAGDKRGKPSTMQSTLTDKPDIDRTYKKLAVVSSRIGALSEKIFNLLEGMQTLKSNIQEDRANIREVQGKLTRLENKYMHVINTRCEENEALLKQYRQDMQGIRDTMLILRERSKINTGKWNKLLNILFGILQALTISGLGYMIFGK
jgi:DNA-binding response OmpR family regulator